MTLTEEDVIGVIDKHIFHIHEISQLINKDLRDSRIRGIKDDFRKIFNHVSYGKDFFNIIEGYYLPDIVIETKMKSKIYLRLGKASTDNWKTLMFYIE